jgi:hypothetical protein
MTSRSDIIDKSEVCSSNGSIRKYGLIYTETCGWVDLGHANPNGKGFESAASLWGQIRNGTEVLRCVYDQTPLKVTYTQSMKRYGIKDGITRHYEVQRQLLSVFEQEEIALAIFMDVSTAFEGLQSNWFYSHITNSGYSVEDLVSNLIGFYRAVRPGFDFMKVCKPVSKEQSLATWDTYGAVGDNKNKKFQPILYPNLKNQCGIPFQGKLPPELDAIRPAIKGRKFKEV